MSGLFAVVIVIIAGFALHGYIKGMVRVVFSLVSIFLTIILVSWLSPYTAEFLQNHTPLYRIVREKAIEQVQLKSQKEIQQKTEEQEPLNIAGIELPEEWQELLSGKAAAATDDLLEEGGVYERMGEYIAGMTVKVTACILSFIIIIIVLRILVHMLDIVARLPVLKSMNHLGGVLAGAAEGVVMVWILFFIITLCQGSEFGKQMIADINSNILLKVLYENNRIQYLILTIFL